MGCGVISTFPGTRSFIFISIKVIMLGRLGISGIKVKVFSIAEPVTRLILEVLLVIVVVLSIPLHYDYQYMQ